MPTMIIEGGRPAARTGTPALVFLSEIPTTPDIGVRYYNAISVEPESQVNLGGMRGGILSVISNCPVSAVQGCYINTQAFGWVPQAAPRSRLPVDKIKAQRPNPEAIPMAHVMQHLMAIQATNVAPEQLPHWMQLQGSSGRVFRPCGTAVGPRGACLGSPCPEGPCALNRGGACVWSEKKQMKAPPVESQAALPHAQVPAPDEFATPPQMEAQFAAPPQMQQAPGAMLGGAAVVEGPENGAPVVRNKRGQFSKKDQEKSDEGKSA